MDRGKQQAAGGAAPAHGGALALVGLAGIAITQPILDVMGRNPEFFVAGRYTGRQIVAFSLIVALGPALALTVVFTLARLAHPRLGMGVHGLLSALLGALFANVLVQGIGADGMPVAVVATLLGGGLALLLSRAPTGRLLLRYLSAANVLFLAAFLFASPASALLSQDTEADSLGAVTVPEPPGPVVFIVFDELPVSTLMHTDGTINAERYPSFARLAAGSTWFRNTSATHSHTALAVPDLLTGVVQDDNVLPTFTAMPRNLLSVLGTGMPVERYESVSDLCPRSVCAAQESQPTSQALSDALIVFGHRVLPDTMREDLPSIDESWGSFGEELDDGPRGVAPTPGTEDGADPLARWHSTDLSERNPATQASRLVEHGLAVGDAPTLHFMHVVLPHAPWFITPWSTRLMRPMPEWHHDDPGPLGQWSGQLLYQRHSLQTGAADVALGQVLDHLETSGVWDDATVVVVADHGTSTIPPGVGREPNGDNEEEIFRVPFFLKLPGQSTGEIVDDTAMTIDVLPTLLDALDVDVDWELDGHSLLDGSTPTTRPIVDRSVDALFAVVDRHAADFPNGWDWTALAAVGDLGPLVGTPVADLEEGAPSDLTWTPNNEDAFAQVPDERGEAPQLVTGRVSDDRTFVLAVNGTIAGIAGGFDERDGGWAFSSLLAPLLRAADNDLVAYEVTGPPTARVLHRMR